MDDYIGDTVSMGSSLIITAIVVGLLGFLATTAITNFYTKDNQNMLDAQLSEYRQVAPYDNKVMKGSDVIYAIQKFNGKYYYMVDLNSMVGVEVYTTVDSNLANTVGPQVYSADYLKNLLGNLATLNYKSELIWDSSHVEGENDPTMLLGIKFTTTN